jgi:hypothetical protein
LEDNIRECRDNLLGIFSTYLKIDAESHWYKAALVVLNANLILGDALTLKGPNGEPINFPEWGYLGSGKYQRRDFRYDSLTQRSSIEGSLFEFLEEHEVFVPTKSHAPMTVEEISQ